MTMYHVIYDGNCNLCVTLVKFLESVDQGQQFSYVPMQDHLALNQFGITPQDCEQGMLLIQADNPQRRWQGSNAAEEIGRLLPAGRGLVELYRSWPGMKWLGDRLYEQVRDHRYALFGQRTTYYANPPVAHSDSCDNDSCQRYFGPDQEHG